MILIIEDLHQLDTGSDIAEPACPRSLALGLQRMGFNDAQQLAEHAARDADGRRMARRRRADGDAFAVAPRCAPTGDKPQ